jgi:hypothetical protein
MVGMPEQVLAHEPVVLVRAMETITARFHDGVHFPDSLVDTGVPAATGIIVSF